MAIVFASDSIRDWAGRHRTLVDAGLAAAVAALAAPDLTDSLSEPGPRAGASEVLAWIILAALTVPLVWRRKAPVAVFAAVAAVAFVQWLTVPPFAGDVAVLVALYTVAAYEPRRWPAIASAAVALLGVVLVLVELPADSDPVLAALSLTALVAVAIALGLYVATRRRYIASLQERGAESERARIAREMHDIVAHGLVVMTALADGARLTVRRDPGEAERALRQLSETGRQSQAEMRRLLGVLREPHAARPELAPQPGLADLDELVDRMREAGLDVRLTVTGDATPVEEGVELAAYRIVQEALSNTLKHAPSASKAEVRLRYCDRGLEIDVTDDSDSAPRERGGGHGIAGMRQRAAAYGAVLAAGPRAGGGWRVHTRLPRG